MTPDGIKIMGYYSLNAHSIDYRELAHQFARDRPASGLIPASFIAMIAVDKDEQGKGYGGDLLADALKRISEAQLSIGVSIALLDVLDDGDETAVSRRVALYAAYGFQPLAERPLRMWISVREI